RHAGAEGDDRQAAQHRRRLRRLSRHPGRRLGMDGILIQADTVRSATLRHEVPLAIIDPFTYLETDGRRVAVVSSLESDRVSEVVVDDDEFVHRRRAKNEMEIAGVRRAQAAATHAMGIAADMLRRAAVEDGVLTLDGEPLTSERIREAMREHAAAMGAPMPGD